MSQQEQEPHDEPRGAREDQPARDRRMEHQARWVDLMVQRAIERGEFDDLPGAGKPLPDDSPDPDPDWWVKRMIERERISVLPPALALRNDDARLEETLDREASEQRVRETLEQFNARVVEARRQLQGGPPVITALRDVEAEVEAWRVRRREMLARAREAARRRPEEQRTDRSTSAWPWRRRRR